MTAAIIQARIGSTRLANKVLLEIQGKTMLWHLIERIKPSRLVDEIILAIPDNSANDILEKFAKDNNLKYFRGPEEDVLARYYLAAQKFGADIVVRVTSDCPLLDYQMVDKVVEKYLASGKDYTSNIQSRAYPKGMDVEVIKFSALEKAYRETTEAPDREHVTLYIRRHPHLFSQVDVVYDKDLSAWRWTVDEKEDLEFVREVYKRLYQPGKIFLMTEIIQLLEDEPPLLEINKNIKRKPIGRETK